MENDTVDDILLNPFARRSFQEKLLISSTPVPQPKLENLKSQFSRGGKVITRNFNVSAYDTKWLSGSKVRNKRFCWPCLLFQNPEDKCVWIKEGFSDLNHLSAAIKIHSASKEHIANAMAHRTFGKIRIDEAMDHAREVSRRNHNLQVKKNRDGMKTLIDLICYLGSHGLSFRGHNETENSVNRGNYKDLCEFIATRDSSFLEFTTNSQVFSGMSATIQNELIEVIGSLIEQISREVDEAEFVAVMVDETTDISRKSQLATTLRYCLKNGTTVERFVSLDDVSSNKSAVALADEIVALLKKIQVPATKLVAQTYDGARLKELDYVECGRSVRNARTNIHKLRNEAKFKVIWEETVTMTGGNSDGKQFKQYFKTYISIIDRIISELDERFADLNKQSYLSLLDSTKFKAYCDKFPKELVDDVCSRFSNFDKVKLTNELKVFYTKDEFAGRKVAEIMNVLVTNNLEDIFSETHRLARLILTLPSTTASVERSFSILRRIKTYLRSTMAEERLKWLMLMSVENALLHQLKLDSNFFDEIIDRFARRVDRRVQLLYK
ncbi:uncharacterized protein LOC134209723 [Armigeres subalbatus]|uniref:uncharacterized protein LOC134209723 n=1 Tax=Armigeres subalbatus TaxID=124917 RepID=UPI002ED021E4